MLKSIKSAFALRLLFFFVFLSVLTLLVTYVIVKGLRTKIAENYSSMYARTAKRGISSRMGEYISAMLRLAEYPAIKNWLLDEFNPIKKVRALKTMEVMRSYLKKRPGLFVASAASLRYYYNNRYLVTMKRQRPSDEWFFKLLKKRQKYVQEIDYDVSDKKIKYWISVPVYSKRRMVGVVGIGMDISIFIKTMLHIDQPNSFIVMFDKSGLLKAAANAEYINKKYVFGLVGLGQSHIALRANMQKMELDKRQKIQNFSFSQGSDEYIACLTYVHEIGWYALVVMDASSIIRLVQFLPIIFVMVAAFLSVLFSLLLLSNRLILRPLLSLANTMERTGQGNLKERAETVAKYELARIADKFNSMLDEIEKQQEQLIVKERMEKEFEIVRQMQASILPEIPEVEPYEISARMIPADEVGGDYYDFYCLPSGRVWFGIGDVTGHGIVSGIIMLMAQTTVNAIIKMCPDISPADLAVHVNRALYENIKTRLRSHSYMTFYFLVSDGGGHFRYAGCHSDILIYRSEEKRCVRLQPDGTWLGVFPDISREIVEKEFALYENDLLVLYTDGIIEAADINNEQFSVERLMTVVEENALQPVDDLRRIIIDSVIGHMEEQKDDITLYIIRRKK